jgi:hypothetical protein
MTYTAVKNMPYTKVQFIAFCVYTGPNNVWENGKWKQEYNGGDDIQKDINTRIEILKNVIDEAKKKVGSDEKILKIFMIPEMFFQPKTGAYSLAEVESIIKKLQNLVQNVEWKDWIFIFGTILQISGKTLDGKISVRNFCLVQKGGFIKENPSEYSCIVDKEKSSGEFIEVNELSNNNSVKNPLVANTTVLQSELRTVENRRQNFVFALFEDNGTLKLGKWSKDIWEKAQLTFGLEICADHGSQTLLNLLRETKIKPLDIQLVTSCGTDIYRPAISNRQAPIKHPKTGNPYPQPEPFDVVKDGGFVFNCDGQTFQFDDRKLNVAIPRMNIQFKNLSGETLKTKKDPTYDYYHPHSEVQKITIPSKGLIAQDIIPPNIQLGSDITIFPGGKGALHIYPPQEVPSSPPMGKTLSIFPDVSSVTAMSNEPFLLNRMKVIFDQSTPVYPVNLKRKGEVRRGR